MMRWVKHNLKRSLVTAKLIPEYFNPTWLRIPESIQIDTLNYCTLTLGNRTGCVFCNVKKGGSYGIPRGIMQTDMIKYILDYFGKYREVKHYAPFVNGEPLLDYRLPWFYDYVTDHTHGSVVIDTNGTNYAARERLIHPNLKQVRFSLCAADRETYEKVHGADLYRNVIKTVEWFIANKYPTQQTAFHFMVNKYNEDQINEFLDQWKGYLVKLFPLHQMPGIQGNSETSLPSEKWVNNGSSIEAWKASRPIFVYPDGYHERRVMRSYMVCQGMSFCVNHDGLILHCSDAPVEYNYGHIYKIDPLEAWQLRNRNRLTNPACQACNAKRPDWVKTLRRYNLE